MITRIPASKHGRFSYDESNTATLDNPEDFDRDGDLVEPDEGLNQAFYESLEKGQRSLTNAEYEKREEQRRKRTVYTLLSQGPQSPDDDDALYLAVMSGPQGADSAVDGMGNTVAHYLANPESFPVIAHHMVPKAWVWAPATARQKEAMEEWMGVLAECHPSCRVENSQGQTPVSLAQEHSRERLDFLLHIDTNATPSFCMKARAYAILLAAGSTSPTQESAGEVVDTLLSLGAMADDYTPTGISFKAMAFLLPVELGIRGQLDLMYMSKGDRDAIDIDRSPLRGMLDLAREEWQG